MRTNNRSCWTTTPRTTYSSRFRRLDKHSTLKTRRDRSLTAHRSTHPLARDDRESLSSIDSCARTERLVGSSSFQEEEERRQTTTSLIAAADPAVVRLSCLSHCRLLLLLLLLLLNMWVHRGGGLGCCRRRCCCKGIINVALSRSLHKNIQPSPHTYIYIYTLLFRGDKRPRSADGAAHAGASGRQRTIQ